MHIANVMAREARRLRGGFTIVELLMVIGIIGILMGLVTVTALGSLKQSRSQKADALCRIVEQGIATYYAQKDRWPGVDAAKLGTRMNKEGQDDDTDTSLIVMEPSEVRDILKEIVKESVHGNPLLDISGLYVSRDPGESNGTGMGLDFFEAVKPTKRSSGKGMVLSEMYFGYQDPDTGYFRRFKIVYSIPTDEMKVYKQ